MYRQIYHVGHPASIKGVRHRALSDCGRTQNLFAAGDTRLTPTHSERMVIEGVQPARAPLHPYQVK